jgi:hypothetical protein
MPGQPRHHRVAFVAAAADGVEDFVLHPQHPRHQIEMAADQLRFEQLAKAERIQGAAVQNRFLRRGLRLGRAVPAFDELLKIDIADLGAVQTLHAGRDRSGNGREHAVIP